MRFFSTLKNHRRFSNCEPKSLSMWVKPRLPLEKLKLKTSSTSSSQIMQSKLNTSWNVHINMSFYCSSLSLCAIEIAFARSLFTQIKKSQLGDHENDKTNNLLRTMHFASIIIVELPVNAAGDVTNEPRQRTCCHRLNSLTSFMGKTHRTLLLIVCFPLRDFQFAFWCRAARQMREQNTINNICRE